MSTFVDGLVELDREQKQRRAIEQYLQAERRFAATYIARVLATMEELQMEWDEATGFIEIEDLMDGAYRLRVSKGEKA